MNPITEELWYTDDEDKNMRLCISSYTKHPVVWTLSKCENMQPMGIQTLTFYQTVWNDTTDYIEKDENGNVIGLWANYLDSSVEPINISENVPSIDAVTKNLKITSSTYSLKVGGSYKTLTVDILNSEIDIITLLSNSDIKMNWYCSISDENWTDKVAWRAGSSSNQIKIKFPSDKNQLGKSLKIWCELVDEGKTYSSLPFQLDLSE